MFVINFSWLFPESITLGIVAQKTPIFSYIATPIKFMIVIVLNLTYFRKSNAVKKKCSDWLKSIIFSLFVPFYMFSRIGAYFATILLSGKVALSMFMASPDNKGIEFVRSNNETRVLLDKEFEVGGPSTFVQ